MVLGADDFLIIGFKALLVITPPLAAAGIALRLSSYLHKVAAASLFVALLVLAVFSPNPSDFLQLREWRYQLSSLLDPLVSLRFGFLGFLFLGATVVYDRFFGPAPHAEARLHWVDRLVHGTMKAFLVFIASLSLFVLAATTVSRSVGESLSFIETPRHLAAALDKCADTAVVWAGSRSLAVFCSASGKTAIGYHGDTSVVVVSPPEGRYFPLPTERVRCILEVSPEEKRDQILDRFLSLRQKQARDPIEELSLLRADEELWGVVENCMARTEKR
jgi:hypothetical protein